MKKSIFMLAFILLLTACASNPAQQAIDSLDIGGIALDDPQETVRQMLGEPDSKSNATLTDEEGTEYFSWFYGIGDGAPALTVGFYRASDGWRVQSIDTTAKEYALTDGLAVGAPEDALKTFEFYADMEVDTSRYVLNDVEGVTTIYSLRDGSDGLTIYAQDGMVIHISLSFRDPVITDW